MYPDQLRDRMSFTYRLFRVRGEVNRINSRVLFRCDLLDKSTAEDSSDLDSFWLHAVIHEVTILNSMIDDNNVVRFSETRTSWINWQMNLRNQILII